MQKALQKIIHDSKCLFSTPMGIMVTEFFEKRLKALGEEQFLSNKQLLILLQSLYLIGGTICMSLGSDFKGLMLYLCSYACLYLALKK